MENNNPNKKSNKKRYYRHHNKKKNKKDEINEISSEEDLDVTTQDEEITSAESEENLEFLEDMIPEVFEAPTPKKESDPNEEQIEVVGVRFKKVGKVYYFSPEKIQAKKGEFAIVDTARGPEFGEIFIPNKTVGISEIVPPLRPVLRIATPEDIIHNDENTKKEKEAFGICLEQIAKHELDMKLVDAQYTFDNSKLLFYFTSAGRVDFRDLVKDLAAVFRTRIELRQIGIRDEAKLIGGLGACGRPLCCATFLSDFVQVSIKMAKEQGLFLNSSKISGTCGRLMCCLRYEQESYEYEIARTPALESTVKTPDGIGTVTESHPLTGFIKVKFTNKDGESIKPYHRDDVKIIHSQKKAEKTDIE
jgi:cell fate regulator YaaT (PSP1 superfamily)